MAIYWNTEYVKLRIIHWTRRNNIFTLNLCYKLILQMHIGKLDIGNMLLLIFDGTNNALMTKWTLTLHLMINNF